MKSFSQFILEENYFNIPDNRRSFWWDIIDKARYKFKILFDLENVDPSTYKEPIKLYKAKSGKEFLYQEWFGAGDWETITLFYCCQKKGGNEKDCFVFIPGKEEGNPQLIKSPKRKEFHPLDDQDKIKPIKTKCLSALKKYLDKQ